MPMGFRKLVLSVVEPSLSKNAREITLDTTLSQIFYAKSTIEMGLSEFEILDTENRPLVAAAAQIESLCTDEIPVTALYAPDDHWAPLWQKEVLDRSINAPLYRSFLVDASHAYPAYTACSEAVVKAWGAPLADVAAERV
jgi:hypothetical protein